MSELLDKIARYDVLTTLLPGIIFCVLSEYIIDIRLKTGDLFIDIFIFYAIGMVIDRFGSLLVEPFFKFLSIVQYSPYERYLEAVKEDAKIFDLVESANALRTAVSLCFMLLITAVAMVLGIEFSQISTWEYAAASVVGMIFFTVSWRKRVAYIKRRIENASRKSDRDAV